MSQVLKIINIKKELAINFRSRYRLCLEKTAFWVTDKGSGMTVVALFNRKMGNSTPCKIVTPKNFNLKLCIRDYVGKDTVQIVVLIGTVGASPHIGEILPLCDFFF